MAVPEQVRDVCLELESHLDKFDWSHLTHGRMSILKAFLHLATTEGYGAVTMRSLGRFVNIKPPSIYSHFPNGRDEILAESLRWHYYNFGTLILEELKGSDSTEDYLRSLVKVHLSSQVQRPDNDLWDLLVLGDRIGNFLPPQVKEEVQYWVSLCIRLYEASAKQYTSNNTEIKAHMALTFLDRSSSWGNWNGTEEHLEELCDKAFKSVLSLYKTDL